MAGPERTPDALRDVQRLYSDNVNTLGVGPKSVGWRDEGAQRLRFEKLAHVIASGDERFTVNDLGCGYGGMFDYLAETHPSRLEQYAGYDISPEMLRAARASIHDARAQWIESDRLTEAADYTFVSGTFHVKFGAGNDEWHDYVLAMLDNVAEHSTRGFAFNLFTRYVDWQEPHLYYADPCFFVDHCIRNYSRRVALLHDYPLWEFTIAVTKA